MRTHIVATVGKNPLPVVVAMKRLGELFQADGPPQATALYSRESYNEYQAIRKLTGTFVRWDDGQQCDPYDPKSIEAAAERAVAAESCEVVHLHYTGGTKAMGVHALRKLQQRAETYRVATSYLDPRLHEIHYWPTPLTSCLDERRNGWNLSLEDLAKLHGLTPAGGGENHPWDVAGAIVEVLRVPAERQRFTRWLAAFRKSFTKDGETYSGWPKPPSRGWWPKEPVEWLAPQQAEDLDTITDRLNAFYQREKSIWQRSAGGGWLIDVNGFSRERLGGFYKFLAGSAFEGWTYEQLRDLTPERNSRRSFTAMALGSPKTFELDVCLVFGYQLVVISCTTDEGPHVKQKAFEVWHRARQLGGDGARAIVLSFMPDDGALTVEQDLAADIGLGSDVDRLLLPLRVWGIGAVEGDLRSKFKEYLRDDLKWSDR